MDVISRKSQVLACQRQVTGLVASYSMQVLDRMSADPTSAFLPAPLTAALQRDYHNSHTLPESDANNLMLHHESRKTSQVMSDKKGTERVVG